MICPRFRVPSSRKSKLLMHTLHDLPRELFPLRCSSSIFAHSTNIATISWHAVSFVSYLCTRVRVQHRY